MTDAIVVNKKAWRLSPIWFLPFTALLLSIWLAYDSYMHQGVKVNIHFTTGSGIQINKTKVMYKGISIGKVIDVEIHKTNIEQVIVTIMLDKRIEPYLLTDTQFWLVKPSISLGGISGLDTLVSGNYIAIKPGFSGTKQKKYIALKEAPIDGDEKNGLIIDLQADSLGSIVVHSPIYYKKIQVGEVLGSKFNKNNNKITIKIKIEDEYADLVKKYSRFYNVSGIEVTGGLAGIKIKTESLAAMVIGGIGFYNPENTSLHETAEDLHEMAEDGDQFLLFDDFELADIGIPILLKLKNAQSLQENVTEIKYLGKKVGFIKKINIDYKTGSVSANAYINPLAEDLLKTATKIWKVKAVVSVNQITGLETLLTGVYLSFGPIYDIAANNIKGEPMRVFEVLEIPPAVDNSQPGLHLKLTAKRLGSLQIGSGIYLKNIQIGSVQAYNLNTIDSKVSIQIFIEPEYSSLINANSKFYTSSGLSIKGGLSGLSIKTESLSSILSGGISVYNSSLISAQKNTATLLANNTTFELYDDIAKAQAGQEITLYFSDVNGIKENQTRIIYKGIDLGYVSQIIADQKIQKIKVVVKIDSAARKLLKENTVFWLVKAEVSLAGVSDLDTLIGGNYITFKPGDGKLSRSFTALSSAPVINTDNGLMIAVKTPELGSISIASPVLYHQLPVGSVSSYYLDKKGENIIINLYIEDKYKNLVKKHSRFYQASGISIKGSFSNIDIRTESVKSIFQGGIAFFTPKAGFSKSNETITAKSGELFELFSDRQSAQKNQFLVSVAFPNVRGLNKGTKVKYNGLKVGEVSNLNLHTDLKQVVAEILIDNKLKKVLGENSRFMIAKAKFGLAQTKNLDTLIAGSYIVLEAVSGKFSDYFEAQEMKSNRGLELILETNSLASIVKDNPVYYRQVQVGKVLNYELSNTADKVLIYILIEQKYASLVRENSKFWNASGFNMDINLFADSKIKTESLQSIVDGGISFATPEAKNNENKSQQQNLSLAVKKNSKAAPDRNNGLAKKVKSGTVFTLHKEVEEKWLDWNPKIRL